MKKKKRIVLIVCIVFLVLAITGFYVKDDALMMFNKQLDNKTKQLMKEKLNTVQIKNVVFSDKDLTNFKEQIAQPDFKYDNLEYYEYFNEMTKATNIDIVKKANQYQKEAVSLTMIKDYNKETNNLKMFRYVLEKGVYGDKSGLLVINPANELTIANKYRYIHNYVPKDLVNVDGVPKLDNEEYLLTAQTKDALVKMCQTIEKDIDGTCGGLVLTSAYRNYATQKKLYNNMIKEDSSQAEFVNRAGTSEHQLGNTFDIMASSVKTEDYYKTSQFSWIKENAVNYGFIIRYPKNKENITMINYEPWHLRYVGIDLAKKLTSNGLTLEEYYNEIYK